MKIEKIGAPIAERELDGQNGGKPCKVVVRFGEPFQDERADSWYCPYSITSPKGERLFYGAGLDSLQALRIAISNVGAELTSVYSDLKLRWADGEDLGFSSFSNPTFAKTAKVGHPPARAKRLGDASSSHARGEDTSGVRKIPSGRRQLESTLKKTKSDCTRREFLSLRATC
jgi:hypothetical protein